MKPLQCDKCFNKYSYATKEDALCAVQRIEADPTYVKKEGTLMPYKCPYSEYWHIGHR